MEGLAGANNYVKAIAVQTNSKVLIGGDFTAANGVDRYFIARLNADGSLDTSFETAVNGGVYCLALQSDGKVLIGGSFTRVNGVARDHIARLKADGSVDETLQNNQGGADDYVDSICLQADGQVLIAGRFGAVNGVPMSGVARVWGEALDRPRLRISRSDGFPALTVTGVPTNTCTVEYTSALPASGSWVCLTNLALTDITHTFLDLTAGNAPARFYRAWQASRPQGSHRNQRGAQNGEVDRYGIVS
jgi:uncharacterized delta-60 repeat protein